MIRYICFLMYCACSVVLKLSPLRVYPRQWMMHARFWKHSLTDPYTLAIFASKTVKSYEAMYTHSQALPEEQPRNEAKSVFGLRSGNETYFVFLRAVFQSFRKYKVYGEFL